MKVALVSSWGVGVGKLVKWSRSQVAPAVARFL